MRAGLELARVPAPADFEVFNTNWHPQSSFYVTGGTLSFKFLAEALLTEIERTLVNGLAAFNIFIVSLCCIESSGFLMMRLAYKLEVYYIPLPPFSPDFI